MATPYIGEIRLFAFGNRGAPNGWQACDGSLLPIAQFDTLFALVGTTYGGDGVNTFAVPDLRGRVPLHQGTGPGLSTRVIGEVGGNESVSVLTSQMPAHTHTLNATSSAATALTPGPGVLPGAVSADTFYVSSVAGANTTPLSAQTLTISGGNQPHSNTMPTLTVQFCIATEGIFPSRS